MPHLYGTRVHPMQNKEPGSYVLPMDGLGGPSATRELQGILLGQKPDGATDAEWKAATGRAFVEAYGRRRGELSLDEKIEAVGTLEGSKPDAETSAWIKEEKTRILDETIAAPVYSEEQAVLRRLAELEKLSPAERNRRTSVEAFHAAQLAEGMDANHVDSLLTWGHDPSTGRFGIFARPTDKNDPLYDWMRRNEKDKTVSRVVFGANHSTAGNDVLAREIAQAMPQYGFDPDDPYVAEKIADRLKQEYEAYQDWKERGAPTVEREIQDREEIDHYAGREREPAEVDSEIVRGHVDAEPENRASQEAEAWRETDPEALEAWEESVPYAEKNPDGTVNVPIRSLRTYGGSGMKPSGSAESGEVTAVENADGTLTVIGGNASAGAAGPDATVPVRIVGKDTGTVLGNSRYLLKASEKGADPDGKLRTHGLDGLSGEAAREKAYAQAEENVPMLKDIVNDAVSQVGGKASFRSANADGPNVDPREVGKEVKKRKRVDEKTANDYGGDYGRVVDLIGGTVSLPDDASFVDTIARLEVSANRFGASIAKVKPFNMGPDATGYQDIKVSIRFQNGGIGEVIVASDYMLDAKNNRGGHKIYEVQRVLDGILENDKEGRIKLSQEEKDQIANVRDILAGFTVVLYSRGESARERLASVSWDRMKSMASSSVQDLLPMLGRRSIISSKDIKEVKSLADEFHLAKPPSVDSNAMPSRSFIQNDIVNNPLSNGEYTQPGNGVKGNPQGEGAIPSAEEAMASYDPQTREIFEADYSEDPAQLDAAEFRLTSGPVQTMFDFTQKDAAAFPVRPTENKAKAMELRREESSERAPGDEPTTPVEEYYPFVKAILPFVKVSNGGSKEIGARIREEGKRRSRRKQETVRTVLQGKEASERDAAEWLMGTRDANADVKRAAIEAEKRRTMSPAERAAEDQPVMLRQDVERRYLLERQPGIRGDEWD